MGWDGFLGRVRNKSPYGAKNGVLLMRVLLLSLMMMAVFLYPQMIG